MRPNSLTLPKLILLLENNKLTERLTKVDIVQ